MLFDRDSIHGHIIVNSPAGAVYEDDGTLVDASNLRPCKGCSLHIARGSHDPCIANLPGTKNACCGHGLDRTASGHNPNGYVALADGRMFRFSGLCGGERIREAVDAALKGDSLPEGFQYDEQKAWWTGLSEAQRSYVQERMTLMLYHLVEEARPGTPAAEAIITGEQMWYEGLNDDEKAYVFSRIPDQLAELAAQAKQSI